jgi:hypothetical protein
VQRVVRKEARGRDELVAEVAALIAGSAAPRAGSPSPAGPGT